MMIMLMMMPRRKNEIFVDPEYGKREKKIAKIYTHKTRQDIS